MEKKEGRFKQKTLLRELLFSSYEEGEVEREELVSRLAVSERQFYRLLKRYRASNDLGHGLCGKRSNHSLDIAVKAKVLELYRNKYRGFNYEHFCEMLELHESIQVKSDCVRKWLLHEKVTLPRKRSKLKKTKWREPKGRFNEMVQIDGTFGHFLDDDELYCLMHMVDDATKTSMAILCKAECTESAILLLYSWCCRYGIPESVYTDKHSTYKVIDRQKLTVEEEVEGKSLRLSEFGKICVRLGVKQIFAHSPQAKGRVENKHKLYKDRFIKELILHNYKSLEEANNFLLSDGGFTDRLNSKFTVKAREEASSSVLIDPSELAHKFTVNQIRTVRNDYTISLNNVVYQLSGTTLNSRSRVTIKRYLDGSLVISSGSIKLKYKIIDNYVKAEVTAVKKAAVPQSVKPKVAKHEHPYRKGYPGKKTTVKASVVNKSDNGKEHVRKYLDYLSRSYG